MDSIITHTVAVVAAYVSRNAVPADQLPGLIAQVHYALRSASETPSRAELHEAGRQWGRSGDAVLYKALKGLDCLPPKQEPAVPVKKSVHADYIVCLEDGKKFKSMRRHLKGLGMTPEEYRAKWGLDSTYPIVCSSYSAKRSALAKSNGLGRKA